MTKLIVGAGGGSTKDDSGGNLLSSVTRSTSYSLLVNVVLDLLERPGNEGVDLDQATLVDLDDLEVGTVGTLATPAAGDDGTHTEVGVRTSSGLNLDEVVVASLVSLPELVAVLGGKLLLGRDTGRGVDGHGDEVGLLDGLGQLDGLGEVVESVKEDLTWSVTVDTVERGAYQRDEVGFLALHRNLGHHVNSGEAGAGVVS